MIEELDQNEYIGISEFAKRVNVSKQAVYQQLDKKLKPYLIVIDGKKRLNIKAISEVYDKQSEEIDKEVEQEENNQLIDILTNQLIEKDKQIDGLIKSLSLAQMQLTEVSHRLQELEDKSHEEPDQEEDQQSVEEEKQQDVAEDSKDWRIQELEQEIEKLEAERNRPWWKKIF